MAATQMITTIGNTEIVSIENFGDTTIEGFIASRHCSENTAKTYRNSIRQMLKFFAAQNITAPKTADVDAFINKLRADKKAIQQFACIRRQQNFSLTTLQSAAFTPTLRQKWLR